MPSALLAAAALTAAGGGTAPSYPGNTIAIARPERFVAASVQRVRLSGRAVWNESPTSDTTIGYSLSLYVQNAAVDDHCEPSYSAQLQKAINLPGLNAATAISGFVMQDDFNVDPQPPASTLDWSGESIPFAVKVGVPRIVLCAYQRYVIDDVAWYQLPLAPQARAARSRAGACCAAPASPSAATSAGSCTSASREAGARSARCARPRTGTAARDCACAGWPPAAGAWRSPPTASTSADGR